MKKYCRSIPKTIILIFAITVLASCSPSDYKYKISNAHIDELVKLTKSPKEAIEFKTILAAHTLRIKVYGGKTCKVDVIKSYDLTPDQIKSFSAEYSILTLPEFESLDCVWINDWNWASTRMSMQDGILFVNDTRYEKRYDFNPFNLLNR